MDSKAAARKRAGRSRAWAAAQADVSEGTARIYELDPHAVEDDKRRALDAVYAKFPPPPGTSTVQVVASSDLHPGQAVYAAVPDPVPCPKCGTAMIQLSSWPGGFSCPACARGEGQR